MSQEENATAKVVREAVVPKNTGMAFIVRQGQYIRVIGESTADFVVFNLNNLRERFDQSRTKVDQGKIYVSAGDVLISKLNNVMMTIVEDGYQEGTHDLQKGMCSRSFYEKWGEKVFEIYGDTWARVGRRREAVPDHGCWENLTEALKPWQVPPEDVPSPLNVFQTMVIDGERGTMRYSTTRPKPGTRIDLRAEMDCLVGISACPEGGRGKELRVVVYQK
ncbi:MAG: DUF1989 domain-containing protein [Candidatus Binatia bacterium]